MKINSKNHCTVSFQKSLVANCAVLKKGESVPCKIYSLNKNDDRDYFRQLETKKEWEDGDFLSHAEVLLLAGKVKGKTVFTLEDEKGNCLGFCCTNLKGENANTVEVIETQNQAKSAFSAKSSYKYPGETLLAFVCKLTHLNPNKNSFLIDSPEESALSFYCTKCGFSPSFENPGKLVMNREKFDKLIEQNESHTGSSIDLVF